MSLDVYLTVPYPEQVVDVVQRIFIRRDGATVEITREEWDELHPGREPVVAETENDGTEAYCANITHNLGRMAAEVDLYKPLWRPSEVGITQAWQLIDPLRTGVDRLRVERERLLEFNPENGWGNYEGLLSFVERYLEACCEHPDAVIRVSR